MIEQRQGRRNDVLDPPQVHMRLSVELESRVRDLEPTTFCTLFLLGVSAIVIDIQDAGRAHNDEVVNFPDEERRSPQIWLFMAMLLAIEATLGPKIGTLVLSDVGATDAVEVMRKTVESSTAFVLNT